MKKLLLSVFLLSGLICFSTTNAQAQLSVKGGLNFANFNDADYSTSSRTGFMAGLSYGFQIPFSPVSIEPGVLYTQKGADASGALGDGTVKLDYIEVPVVAKFDFILDNPLLTPHVYFGPYVGFNVNAESAGENIDSQVKNTDWGVVVGAGADISKFNLGIRYSAGLTDLAENDAFNGKNGVLSIVAGINL